MEIRARNNLGIAIRLTITNSGGTILINVGKKGATLKEFYLACIDTDLLPNKTWEEIGSLKVATEYKLSICGKEP